MITYYARSQYHPARLRPFDEPPIALTSSDAPVAPDTTTCLGVRLPCCSCVPSRASERAYVHPVTPRSVRLAGMPLRRRPATDLRDSRDCFATAPGRHFLRQAGPPQGRLPALRPMYDARPMTHAPRTRCPRALPLRASRPARSPPGGGATVSPSLLFSCRFHWQSHPRVVP